MLTPDIHQQIMEAFRGDHAERLRDLLARHPALKAMVNEPVGPFNSPAIINIRSRAMLDVLLDAGADINAKSRWWAGGFGILHSVDPSLASYAIHNGAVVDAHAAARLGLFDKLKELIAADPSVVHTRGGDGQTPLHFASTIDIAAFLLAHGADIDARDLDHDSTPAQWMVAKRQPIARYLVDRGGKADLLMLAALGGLDQVRAALDANPESIRLRVSDEHFPMIGGRPPNTPGSGGTIYQWELGWYVSAHQVARVFGHGEIFDLLMLRSPDDVKLVAACWLHDESLASSLLAANPGLVSRLRAEDSRQLAHAARQNELAAARLMLDAGWPTDGLTQHRATALHWAAFHGNAEMVRLLLRRNPSLEVKDADHHGTPLGWAIYGSDDGIACEGGDYPAVVQALLNAGAVPPQQIAGSPAVREVLSRGRG